MNVCPECGSRIMSYHVVDTDDLADATRVTVVCEEHRHDTSHNRLQALVWHPDRSEILGVDELKRLADNGYIVLEEELWDSHHNGRKLHDIEGDDNE